MAYKNCNKSSGLLANHILLSGDQPKQSPSFLVFSFKWNKTTIRWNCNSKAHRFHIMLANYVDTMLIHCFCDT